MDAYGTINENSRNKVAVWQGDHMAPDMGRAFLDITRENNRQGRDTLWGMPWRPTRHHVPILEAYHAGKCDLSRVKTFNLDEWLDRDDNLVDPAVPYSFRGGMERHFFPAFHLQRHPDCTRYVSEQVFAGAARG